MKILQEDQEPFPRTPRKHRSSLGLSRCTYVRHFAPKQASLKGLKHIIEQMFGFVNRDFIIAPPLLRKRVTVHSLAGRERNGKALSPKAVITESITETPER